MASSGPSGRERVFEGDGCVGAAPFARSERVVRSVTRGAFGMAPQPGRKRVEGRTGGLSGVGRLGAISRFAGDGRRLGARLGALCYLRASVTRAALSGGGEGPADCFASFYKSCSAPLSSGRPLCPVSRLVSYVRLTTSARGPGVRVCPSWASETETEIRPL